MINKDFYKKQAQQAKQSMKVLKELQDSLDNDMKSVVDRLKIEDPESANKINELQQKSKQIFKQAEGGDFSKINELLNDLKNGFKDNR